MRGKHPNFASRPEYHLAEFNWGTLKFDWGDPQVDDFANALSKVDALAQRSPGYIWQMSEDEMSFHQNDHAGRLGNNPRLASKLSVWEDPQALWHFAYRTVHQRFVKRGPEWYEESQGVRMVLWWVPHGHRPNIIEATDRRDLLNETGNGPNAFGWDWLETLPAA